jgi:cell wall-associated NlpC family hydrolase
MQVSNSFSVLLLMRYFIGSYSLFVFLCSCNGTDKPTYVIVKNGGTVTNISQAAVVAPVPDSAGKVTHIATGNVTPEQVLTFAHSLTGVPYKYGSIDPTQGFDCSGFITYVFNHFGIAVPRTSIDFTYVNHAIDIKDARAGDLILFTGTDSTKRQVGHMGIITSAESEEVTFIHSTSGKDNGVTETHLKPYYMGRYLKTIRIFP